MKKLIWKEKGININGEFLSNLRFADDIILFSETATQLQEMVNELYTVSYEIGLELNITKTKVMTNTSKTNIMVNNIPLEYVQEYVYLSKQISFKKTRHREELNRRINLAWNKFWSNKQVLKSNLNVKLKKQILDSCISYPVSLMHHKPGYLTTILKTKFKPAKDLWKEVF